MENENENREARPEVHNPDDGGRQQEGGNLGAEGRGIEGPDDSPRDSSPPPDGSAEHASVRNRAEMLCATHAYAGGADNAPDATDSDAGTASTTNPLIVDMSLLDARIGIERCLTGEAHLHWCALNINLRNRWASKVDSNKHPFEVAHAFCVDSGLNPESNLLGWRE